MGVGEVAGKQRGLIQMIQFKYCLFKELVKVMELKEYKF